MIFELITSALKEDTADLGPAVLNRKYLKEFIVSVGGYITIDLQHNTDANIAKYGPNQLHEIEEKVFTTNEEMRQTMNNFL